MLGVATSWDEMKGYSDYLKLSEMLGEAYKVVLVGLTKEQVEKLPKNVLGIERTANVQELAEIYTAADVFVNLSYCENYPTVNIEAMACGTPVLTYKTGGSPEIVRDYGGYVIKQGDIDAVEKKIRYIENNGIKLIQIDREKYDNKKVSDKYIKIYTGDRGL